MARSVRFAVLPLLFAGLAFAQTEAPPLPSQDQLKALVEKGDYKEALRGIMRAIELKGPAAAPYNRYELLMLRAECQLQIKETRAALDALALAQKEAAAKGKPDDIGAALALTALVQKSPAYKYAPKATTGPLARKPIDILDRAARPEAYKALYADELAGVRLKVRSVENARTLPPILEAAKQVATLAGIEQVATGERKQCEEMSRNLATNAAVLLASSVNDQAARVDTLYKAANTIVTLPVRRFDQMSGQSWVEQQSMLRGLNNEERRQISDIQAFCKQAVAAANDLALAFPPHADAFKDVASNAATAAARAAEIEKANYENPVQKPN